MGEACLVALQPSILTITYSWLQSNPINYRRIKTFVAFRINSDCILYYLCVNSKRTRLLRARARTSKSEYNTIAKTAAELDLNRLERDSAYNYEVLQPPKFRSDDEWVSLRR